jgi:hypothetical protein
MAFAPAPNIVKQVVDNEALLLDTDNQQIHHLNETAVVLWEHCERGSTIDKIVSDFIQIYEIDEQTARQDIVHTLESWRQLGLIRETPD